VVKVAGEGGCGVVLRWLEFGLLILFYYYLRIEGGREMTYDYGMQRGVQRDICGGEVVVHEVRPRCQLSV
jgi:hypothetical protein